MAVCRCCPNAMPANGLGMDADIVVFDPETISDVGTCQAPNQPVIGVQSLLVSGTLVVEEGKLVTDAAPGQPIRRTVSVNQ